MTNCYIPGDVELDGDLVERYIRILHVARREPSQEALAELLAAHLACVPFENVSKLYRKRQGFTGVPDVRMFLDGIERHHFGGTCYTNNFHLYKLLVSLGYKARLCGADMTNPDVHIVIMVTVDGREYLVDAGYAAPFLAPLPRDLQTNHVVALGRDRYVLKPQDARGYSRLELYRNGVVKHGYLAKPAPRRIEDFAGVIAESFRPAATFFNAVLLARYWRDSWIVIHNLELIESRGTETKVTPLEKREGLAAAIEAYFAIPRPIVNQALAGLQTLVDAWN